MIFPFSNFNFFINYAFPFINIKDATEELSKLNYQLWKEKYEEVYQQPLKYDGEEE